VGLDHGIIIKKKGRGNIKDNYIATFRKCNQIHGWFLRNCIKDPDKWDGSKVKVSEEKLEELYSIVDAVLVKSKLRTGIVKNGTKYKKIFGLCFKIPRYSIGKKIANPRYAKKWLPCTQGFFFGSYDYDEFYLEQLEWVKSDLEKVLMELAKGDYQAYYWAWW
jgi:hypothetical protein